MRRILYSFVLAIVLAMFAAPITLAARPKPVYKSVEVFVSSNYYVQDGHYGPLTGSVCNYTNRTADLMTMSVHFGVNHKVAGNTVVDVGRNYLPMKDAVITGIRNVGDPEDSYSKPRDKKKLVFVNKDQTHLALPIVEAKKCVQFQVGVYAPDRDKDLHAANVRYLALAGYVMRIQENGKQVSWLTNTTRAVYMINEE